MCTAGHPAHTNEGSAKHGLITMVRETLVDRVSADRCLGQRLLPPGEQSAKPVLRHRPPALDGQRLDEALRQLVGRWSAQTGIPATLSLDPVVGCPPPVDEALFRVGQEALANVARHSGARRVHLTLAGPAPAVMLTVADDGVGLMEATRTSGLGLRSMRERMCAVGGTLGIEGRERAGTVVTARWNWSPGGNGE